MGLLQARRHRKALSARLAVLATGSPAEEYRQELLAYAQWKAHLRDDPPLLALVQDLLGIPDSELLEAAHAEIDRLTS